MDGDPPKPPRPSTTIPAPIPTRAAPNHRANRIIVVETKPLLFRGVCLRRGAFGERVDLLGSLVDLVSLRDDRWILERRLEKPFLGFASAFGSGQQRLVQVVSHGLWSMDPLAESTPPETVAWRYAAFVEEAPWIRAQADGFLGLWHMPAGRSNVGVLTACDRPLRDDMQLEERAVGVIPANERCPVCQGVHARTSGEG
jgi:hypothetical protein